jgi:SAM-dependent methyltransferase
MKVHDSGMPDESYWNSLFDIPLIVKWLHLKDINAPIVDLGCGYGTFTVPVAKEVDVEVHAFDIESSMITIAQERVRGAGVGNVRFHLRDVIGTGTGLDAGSVGLVLLFNILHSLERRILLGEASRILKPAGIVAIIHWRRDVKTPRGPDVHSRPDDRVIYDSIVGLDFEVVDEGRILEPYHWGIKLVKYVRPILLRQ